MRRFDQLEPADIQASFVGRVSNSRQGGDEYRLDQPELVGFDGSAQREVVAGVRDCDLDSCLALRGGDQAPVFRTADRLRPLVHRSAPRVSARELDAEQVLDPSNAALFFLRQASRRRQERPKGLQRRV